MLAIGIVVDDAIVVVEAVEHHIEEGMTPRDAAIQAMDEVSGPVIAVGLVLSAVFVPCAFISGIVGQFFRQFALTIAISTVISAFNSLTLSPALAVLLLKPKTQGHGEAIPRFGLVLAFAWAGYAVSDSLASRRIVADRFRESAPAGWPPLSPGERRWSAWSSAGSSAAPSIACWAGSSASSIAASARVTDGYVGSVGLLLAGQRRRAARSTAGCCTRTYDLFSRTPTGFIPAQDKGYLLVDVRLPDSASLDRTTEVMQQIEEIAGEGPGRRAHRGDRRPVDSAERQRRQLRHDVPDARRFSYAGRTPPLGGCRSPPASRRSSTKPCRTASSTFSGRPPSTDWERPAASRS